MYFIPGLPLKMIIPWYSDVNNMLFHNFSNFETYHVVLNYYRNVQNYFKEYHGSAYFWKPW